MLPTHLELFFFSSYLLILFIHFGSTELSFFHLLNFAHRTVGHRCSAMNLGSFIARAALIPAKSGISKLNCAVCEHNEIDPTFIEAEQALWTESKPDRASMVDLSHKKHLLSFPSYSWLLSPHLRPNRVKNNPSE